MAMQSPSSSSSSISYDFSFDAFVSFRGADTRSRASPAISIKLFVTKESEPSLMTRSFREVMKSHLHYASSSFCLDELVHENSRLVLPVFYDVEPSEVRHYNNRYGEALTEFEERFQNNKENMERLQKWKIALNQAYNLSGYHFKEDEYEYEFIKKIVTEIWNKINCGLLEVADHLVVGLDSRLLRVKSGGLGKTTLTRAVYDLIADQFEGLCFLHNVREIQLNMLLSKLIGLEFKFGDVSEGISIIKHRLRQKKV
ncbi:disease resistance protein (TIR-NBS-LRR class), putative [Medicago truncatula]|uniref:Disease resistance protein (TIR-NBS-LRR class), putative n=1 Tax=Medicago truncatula TaxID=3880 RepID=G7KHV7_MEDTR|nr:disease resistance protein (TIR-NBS-LRR class), putative [Medicago truncatula]